MCAAVDKIEEMRKPEDFVGHRKLSQDQLIEPLCIVRAESRFESNKGSQKKLLEKISRSFFNEIHPCGWVKSSSMMKSPAEMKSDFVGLRVDLISSA